MYAVRKCWEAGIDLILVMKEAYFASNQTYGLLLFLHLVKYWSNFAYYSEHQNRTYYSKKYASIFCQPLPTHVPA